MKKGIGASILLFLASAAAAQPSVTGIFARDGWEAFPGVEYQGGDATQPKKQFGILVLTDTSLALYPCANVGCDDRKDKKKPPFKDQAFFSIPLSSIKEITSSSRSRGPSTSERFGLGPLAGSQSEEFVGLVYETATSAEAPVFRTGKAQSAAVDAKLRFRLKKLGIDLPGGTPQ